MTACGIKGIALQEMGGPTEIAFSLSQVVRPFVGFYKAQQPQPPISAAVSNVNVITNQMKTKTLLVKVIAVVIGLSSSIAIVDAGFLPKNHGRRSGTTGGERQVLVDCPNQRTISTADNQVKASKKRPYWWRKKR